MAAGNGSPGLPAEYDFFRRELSAIHVGRGVIVGTKRGTFERNTREKTARTRVTEHFRAKVCIGGCGSVAAHWTRRNRSIATQLYLALKNRTCSPLVHHKQDKIGGLAADLKSDAPALECIHRG